MGEKRNQSVDQAKGQRAKGEVRSGRRQAASDGRKDRARLLYVQGRPKEQGREFPTAREVAQEVGVSPGTLGRWMAEEGWVEQREVFRMQVEEAAREGLLDAIRQEATNAMRMVILLARHNETYLTDYLRQYSEAKERAERAAQRGEKGVELPTPDPVVGATIARALRDTADAVRKAIGARDEPLGAGGIDIVELMGYSRKAKEVIEIEEKGPNGGDG